MSLPESGTGSSMNVASPSCPKHNHTLMGIARFEIHWPNYKNNSQAPFLKSYLDQFSKDEKKANESQEEYFKTSRVSGLILMHDAIYFYTQIYVLEYYLTT